MAKHTDYNLWLLEEKKKYLELFPEDVSTVLDVGCGRGELLHILKGRGYERVEGCDVDERCLEKSARFAPVSRVDILELSKRFPPGSFDLTVCLHILEHVPHPYLALQELKAVSSKYILLAVPNARCIAYDESPAHLYSWNGDTLRNLIEAAGLKVIKLKQDRTNLFPNVLRFAPVINRVLLKLFVGPNELVVLCTK